MCSQDPSRDRVRQAGSLAEPAQGDSRDLGEALRRRATEVDEQGLAIAVCFAQIQAQGIELRSHEGVLLSGRGSPQSRHAVVLLRAEEACLAAYGA